MTGMTIFLLGMAFGFYLRAELANRTRKPARKAPPARRGGTSTRRAPAPQVIVVHQRPQVRP